MAFITTFPAVYGGTVGVETCVACLCPEGRRRLTQMIGIEEKLSAEDIATMYPEGSVPAADPRLMEQLTRASVPVACQGWTLASYKERFSDQKATADLITKADAWLQAAPADQSDWVLLGPNGTGKSGFAIALLRAAVEAGHSAQFWTVKQLSIVWRASYDAQLMERRGTTKREVELLEQLVEPDVLVLDEFGGTTLTDFVESTITLIVDSRQKQYRPTLLTLNVSAADCEGGRKQMHSRVTAMLGPTLSDRLRERAQWYPLTGASQRRAWGKDAVAS
jgi:DNA replication protein DnaC